MRWAPGRWGEPVVFALGGLNLGFVLAAVLFTVKGSEGGSIADWLAGVGAALLVPIAAAAYLVERERDRFRPEISTEELAPSGGLRVVVTNKGGSPVFVSVVGARVEGQPDVRPINLLAFPQARGPKELPHGLEPNAIAHWEVDEETLSRYRNSSPGVCDLDDPVTVRPFVRTAHKDLEAAATVVLPPLTDKNRRRRESAAQQAG